jgi:hypothetical protein
MSAGEGEGRASAGPGLGDGRGAGPGTGRTRVRVTGGTRGNDDGVSGSDFLREATAELYGSDPEEFTERRTALASQARAAGDRAAAKEIAGLRKPTRSAWMINQLIRADPGVADRLAGLGDELRAAAAALDGAKIRELSQERRKLVDTLIRRTLQQAGEQSPSASLREDLTATFGTALADPQVARDLADGTLVRAAHHADFGTGAPELTLVPPPADTGGTTPSSGREATENHGDAEADELKEAGRGRKAGGPGPRRPGRPGGSRAEAASRAAGVSRAEVSRGPGAIRTAKPSGTGEKAKAADEARAARAAERAKAADQARAAEEARAAREARAAEDRQRAVAEAEQTLEEAGREAEQAAQDEQDARATIEALESQLDEAHRRATEARRKARDAQSSLQKARRAVARLTPARRGRA